MKAAISIPDDVFRRADALARRKRQSRSSLYTEALREYLIHHEAENLTEAMRRAHSKADGDLRRFVKVAAERTLQTVEWKE